MTNVDQYPKREIQNTVSYALYALYDIINSIDRVESFRCMDYFINIFNFINVNDASRGMPIRMHTGKPSDSTRPQIER